MADSETKTHKNVTDRLSVLLLLLLDDG